MATSIEIPNVPDALYRTVEARAVRLGMSVPAYLPARIEQEMKPPLRDHAERMRRKPAPDVGDSPAAIILRHRDGGE